MKLLRIGLIIIIICGSLLCIGAKGCAWTRDDPDIVTGSSGETTPAAVELPITSGSSQE